MSLDSQSDKPETDTGKELTQDEVVDILNDDKAEDSKDDKEEDKEDEVEEEEKEDEGDKETEDEDEEKEEELEIEEEQLLVLPRKKEILKAFPDLFKKFPQIEASLYRDRQFTEVFPDVDSAKEAAEKADTYDDVEADINNGDIGKIIAAVKDSGQDAVNRLADEYLDVLAKVDKDAYLHVISGVVKNAVKALAEAGRDNDDEDLLNAARQLNVFMFGKKEYEPHRRLTEKNPESDRLKQDQQNWHNQKFESAKTEAMDKVRNRIQSTIHINIDKKNSMTDYVKKNAVKDAMQILESNMIQDRSFQRTVDNLWKEARKGNLSNSQVDRVISAYLTKAKTLLPGVIQKARTEALKGMPGKRVERDRSGRLPILNRDTGTREKQKSSKEIPKNMSTLDALNSLMRD